MVTVKARIRAAVAVLCGLMASAPLQAQDQIEEGSVADLVLEACSADIETYCQNVTPGRGRLLACFVAHEDKISNICLNRLYDLSDRIRPLFNSVEILGRECGIEIDSFCASAGLGHGRMLQCLDENFEQARSGCRDALIGLGVHVSN